MQTLRIIYASTSGHTEHVVGIVAEGLKKVADVTVTRVERATPEMLPEAGVLLLACGTWNTGGAEGQLNPHMHAFLKEKAAAIDLAGRRVALIELGDDRYRYTAGAGKHLRAFVETHGGTVLGDSLTIVNEPYGQEDAVVAWTKKLSALLQ